MNGREVTGWQISIPVFHGTVWRMDFWTPPCFLMGDWNSSIFTTPPIFTILKTLPWALRDSKFTTHCSSKFPFAWSFQYGCVLSERTNLSAFVPVWLVLPRCEAAHLGVFDQMGCAHSGVFGARWHLPVVIADRYHHNRSNCETPEVGGLPSGVSG